MKQTEEFEGKNIDQAIRNACSALNVTKKNLKYDVISSGSSGIFGLVRVKKARIRVTLPKIHRTDSGENKKNMDSNDSNGVMSIVDEAFGEKKDGTPALNKNSDSPADKIRKSVKKDTHDTNKSAEISDKPVRNPVEIGKPDKAAKPVQKADTPAKAAKNIGEENKSGVEFDIDTNEIDLNSDAVIGSNDNTSCDRTDKKNSTWNEGFPPRYKDETAVDVSEESIATGKSALQKMVDLITTDAVVIAETDHDKLLLKIEGGNSGVLIGRRGQTLEAMQFLCDKIINRQSESRVRLKVDIEGYMETRKANLEFLASKMANKAIKTGRPATINQMTAQDRRIVHLTLKNNPDVRTQSMGEGYYRRLVIFPKRTSYKKNNQPRPRQNNNSHR